MNINIPNKIFYIPLIFIFLPAFSFYMPVLNGVYLYLFLFIYLLLAILFFSNILKFIHSTIDVIKKTPLKYFMLFLLLVSLDSIFLASTGVTTFKQSIRAIGLQIILYVIPIFLYFDNVINRYIPYNKFIKSFYFLFWINLILGLISFLGMFFNITFIINLFDFFANARMLSFNNLGYFAMDASNYYAFGLPRLDNLSVEPSFYANFLFLFLPFVYEITRTRQNIFSNKLFNKIFKFTLLPLTWLNLVLTQSPIYFIISVVFSIIYFYKSLLAKIKQYPIIMGGVVVFFILLLSIIFLNIDMSETFLGRVTNTIHNMDSIYNLMAEEHSLATRIISFFNLFMVFKEHPILGVGVGNISDYMIEQTLHSSLPLSSEILCKVKFAIVTKSTMMFNKNIILCFLAESGFIITSVFIYFNYKIFKELKNIKKQCSKITSFDRINLNIYLWSILTLVMWFSYESYLLRADFLFLYSIIIAFIYKIKVQLKSYNQLRKESSK